MDAPGEPPRLVEFKGGKSKKGAINYATNKIVTSKYTWWSFLPVNIWEQLHKFGNVYFLMISVIMYLGEKTDLFVGTIKAFSTLGLLIMMMAVTGAMAFYDDSRRKEADKEINNAQAKCLNKGGVLSHKTWAEVVVGDVLVVKEDEEFPADVVPLYCSGDGGNCYVSTANLDGETNLKLKGAAKATQLILAQDKVDQRQPMEKLEKLAGSVEAEAPSANIHDFNGKLTLKREGAAEESESLGAKQLLLRGTRLKNTAEVIGLVVYTGADTRMVRNSRPAPLKMSNLESVTNRAMIAILVAQGFLALVSDVLHLMYTAQYKEYWYLAVPVITLPEWFGYWLTFFTLYSNLMPISLYPTMEFCNAFQSYFIQNDRKMYYKRKDFNDGMGFNARARSSNLVHELGQVEYILSDKTGTLTQNVMELKRMAVGGRRYGQFESGGPPGFSGAADVLRDRVDPQLGPGMNNFLEALAVAHTVMTSTDANGQLKYEAESPDEHALVSGVAELGWKFSGRNANTVEVEVSGQSQVQRYIVQATNEFNSTRKRMSVVVYREASRDYVLFVKGADNVMLKRAKVANQQELTRLNNDLKTFATQGLRTLLIGARTITEAEFRAWNARYQAAMKDTVSREEQLMKVAEEIEKDLTILGITAIEDKLQDGVPETIEKIREAGIKLWVLTGDKLETARNIGFSTRVLTENMTILTVDKEEGIELEAAAAGLDEVPDVEKKAIMVSGSALEEIWADEERKQLFLDTAQGCSVLIACRVSPRQKGELVKLVRLGVPGKPVTLAVGDGANDVPMIQEAQVGVGIAGREGRQAVNNSDFAIGQFRYLQRLLLAHGRWNYRRACTYTVFTFWRNSVQVLMIVYYTWISGYSGTSLFEDWVRLSFNPLCTLPILAVGCLDKDVEAKTAIAHPKLYKTGREGMDLNLNKIIFMMMSATVHSGVLHWVTITAFPSLDLRGSGDYYTFGTMCYTCLVLDVNYRAAFMTNTHNWWTIGSQILSAVLYVVFLMCYTEIQWVTNMLEPNMYQVPRHMIKNWYFWFCIILVPAMAMTFDMSMHYFYHKCYPNITDEVEEERRGSIYKLSPCYAGADGDEENPHDDDDDGSSNTEDVDDATDDDEEHADDGVINRADWAQQRFAFRRPMRKIKNRPPVVFIAIGAAIVSATFGGIALWFSDNAHQMRIMYHGESEDNFFWTQTPKGTRDEEKFHYPTALDSSQTFTVTIPRTIRAPVLVYYAIGPYYQNYNAYMKSELSKELRGLEVTEGEREAKCRPERTRVLDGLQIVPCGQKATSVFNDTYEIDGYFIETSEDLAWQSDVARYNNPADYPDRPDTSWLFDRYTDPLIINKTLGVKSEAFAQWMRPSAVPRVWNPYGWINQDVQAGPLTVTVNSMYPTAGMGAYKMLVLTERGPLGGRHHGFAYILLSLSGGCLVLAVMVLFIDFRFKKTGALAEDGGNSSCDELLQTDESSSEEVGCWGATE